MSKRITTTSFTELVHINNVSDSQIIWYYIDLIPYVLHQYVITGTSYFSFKYLGSPAERNIPEIRENTFHNAIKSAIDKGYHVYSSENYKSFLSDLTELPF